MPAAAPMRFPPMRAGRRVRHGRVMSVFVVERYLVGWTVEEMRRLMAALSACNDPVGRVRHLRSLLIAEDETCLSVFEAADADAVAAVNAGLPWDRVVAAEEWAG